VEGKGRVFYRVDVLPLLAGLYSISVAVTNAEDTEMFDYHDRLYPLRVRPQATQGQYGLITLNGHWNHLFSGRDK